MIGGLEWRIWRYFLQTIAVGGERIIFHSIVSETWMARLELECYGELLDVYCI